MTRYRYLIDDHVGIVGTPSPTKIAHALAKRRVRLQTTFGLIPMTHRHVLWIRRYLARLDRGFHPFVYPDGASYYLTKTIKE